MRIERITKSCFLFFAISFFILILSSSAENDKSLPMQEIPVQKPDPSHSKMAMDRILVKFKSGVSHAKKTEILAKHGLKEKSEIKQIGVKILFIPSGVTPEDAVKNLKEKDEGSIEYAEPDAIVPPSLEPNDPYYVYNYQWHLQKIGGPSVWDITTGNNSVVIAVLDTGIDGAHPDLAVNLVPGWNAYDNNSDTTEVYSHGTAVAGTAAAISNNSIGVASVCWNCKIMPIRVSDLNGYGNVSVIASGLVYAADRGARVANISYGVTANATIASAAQYFQSKSGIVTMSSGNQTFFDSTPDNPYVLTVSATDANDTLASFSNTGNNIDLAAPGVSIITAGGGGVYVSATGTSVSAPIVAGVAALMISVNPALTPFQIQDILKQSADDLGSAGWDPQYGWGRVNAYKAVSLACTYAGASCGSEPLPMDTQAPTVPGNLTGSSPDSTQVNLSWIASSDNIAVTGYEVIRDNTLLNATTFTSYFDTTVISGSNYSYSVKAYDAANNLSLSSNTASVTVPNPPDTIAPSTPANLTALAPDSTKVSLSWSASTDNATVAGYKVYRNTTEIGTALSTSYVDTQVTAGTSYSYMVKAYDAAGNYSQASNTVSILVPSLPSLQIMNITVTNKTATAVKINWQTNIQATGYVQYGTASANLNLKSAATALGTTQSVTLTGLAKRTTYTYKITATDTSNRTVSSSTGSFKTLGK